jgi:hypothetical protein
MQIMKLKKRDQLSTFVPSAMILGYCPSGLQDRTAPLSSICLIRDILSANTFDIKSIYFFRDISRFLLAVQVSVE